MNPTDDHLPDHLPTLDDHWLDQLVDGELPEAERRNLLSTLDDLPGGWRRCALAFLEAQSWKDEMRVVRQESDAQSKAAQARIRTGLPGGAWATLLAVAASFLIALGFGLALERVWRPRAGAAPSPIHVAGEPDGLQRPPVNTRRPDTPPKAPAADDGWQLVTLPIGPAGTELIQLPAKEMKRIDDGWPEEFAPTVPADVLQAFEKSGHEIQRHRRLLPFDLDDGRRLVVPFEEVEFHYVGNSAYQ